MSYLYIENTCDVRTRLMIKNSTMWNVESVN